MADGSRCRKDVMQGAGLYLAGHDVEIKVAIAIPAAAA